MSASRQDWVRTIHERIAELQEQKEITERTRGIEHFKWEKLCMLEDLIKINRKYLLYLEKSPSNYLN